jgi:hypothetical protein
MAVSTVFAEWSSFARLDSRGRLSLHGAMRGKPFLVTVRLKG